MVIKGLGNQEIDTAQQASSEAGSMLQHQVNVWRRERDSNPRYGFPYSGFQDRLFQPLTHPSAVNQQFVSLVYISAQTALRGDVQAAPVKVLQFLYCFRGPNALEWNSITSPKWDKKYDRL